MHNEGLCNLYSSQNIMKMIKSRHTDKPCSMQGEAEKCIQNGEH
jgi:hypothetical protein